MNGFIIRKLAFLCCILLSNVFVVGAQGTQVLQAVNDTVRTGPLQMVRKNIIYNDIIPGDTYSWRIITSSLSKGSVSQEGDYIVFVPNPDVRDDTVRIAYELSGIKNTSSAIINIIVTNYNNPVNVINPDVKCVEEMTSGITFTPALKYIGKKGDVNYVDEDRLDGFSMPLVGDLNGDHKPEIVAMGISDGYALAATGDKIIILNGQTGKEIFRYKLSNLGGDYNLRSGPRHNSVSKLAIADLDRNGIGEIVITETGTQGQVHCIEPIYNGENIIDMKKKWTGWTGDTKTVASFKAPLIGAINTIYGSPMPYIADLNADGTPEVIVYNKIYNGVTGELVCTLQTLNNFTFASYQGTTSVDENNRKNIINNYAYTGCRPSAAWYDEHIPCMAIVDINDDGFLDIIAGSKVYLMKDNAGKPALMKIINGPSAITAQRGTLPTSVTTYVTDGFTAVADIDLDGKLDVIVLAPAKATLDVATSNLLYVWDPMSNDPATPKAAVYLYTNSLSGTMSYPFVGDINGALDDYSGTKRLPEICFTGGRFYTSNINSSPIAFHPLASADLTAGGITGASHTGHGFNFPYYINQVLGHIIGFTYYAAPNGSTPMHQRLKLSWAMEHGDESSCTGITMFDFDNDNIKELCYRDESSIRVISPARKTYINYNENVSNNGAIRFKYSDSIGSYTGFEAPVIADVNMDGSADIVTLAHNVPGGNFSKGFVHVFEHDAKTDMWAPCPPVWNQGIYFPFQINEDLTVPAKTQPMLTPYKDVNGNTIYPYNGQWIQQPVVKLNEKYTPEIRMPDAVLMNMSVKVTSAKTTVTLTIYNNGSATINAQTPITFYDSKTAETDIDEPGTTQIVTLPVGIDIFPDEKIIKDYVLNGYFNDHLIRARIVDNKGSFPASGYPECDITNNVFSGADCPFLEYITMVSPDTVLCRETDNALLTAMQSSISSVSTPIYQWYRNDVPIPGATQQTYTATLAGAYKCFVIEGICREFSPTRIITREIPSALDDYVSIPTGVAIKVDILYNDRKSEFCNPIPQIKTPPKHAASCLTDVDGRLLYMSVPGYTGFDTLSYTIDYSEAKVYFKITNLPDNVIDKSCHITPPSNTVWGISETSLNTAAILHNFGALTVGDIDNNDTTEIIGMIEDSRDITNGYPSSGIKIFFFDKSEQKIKLKKQFPFNGHSSSTFGAMAIARYNNKGYIVVAGTDNYLYAYDPDGVNIWKSDLPYNASSGNYGSIVSIVDFDGDGTPEVFTGNSIFSLVNGNRICNGDLSENRGRLLKYSGSLSAAANMTSDKKLNLCAGNKIYEVDFNSHNLSVIKTLPENVLPAHAYRDGATMVADINNDRQLDVIVVSKDTVCDNNGNLFNQTVVYVWTPEAAGTGGALIGHFTVPDNEEYYGIPMIGNIDNTKFPEIVFIGTSNKMYALKYDSTETEGDRIKLKWEFDISNPSTCTGMSLFDFNLDGKNEIVYRDPTSLRIIDGSGSAAKVETTFDNVFSNALREFPVIADIDNDGHAEIVIQGNTSSTTDNKGYLRVFKSSGSPWAPARNVWNQYAYNAVNVYKNLNIPTEQFNIASEFPGPDKDINQKNDNVCPFNGFMQQQTFINEHGTPFMFAPDILFTETIAYDATGDSLTIHMRIKNDGNADVKAPTYISTYKNGIDNTSIDSLMLDIYMNTTKPATATIREFSKYLPADNFSIVLNNRGAGVNIFPNLECNYDNNDTVIRYTSMLLAHNDYIFTVNEAPVTIDIFANDSIPAGCTPSVSLSAQHGSAVIVNGYVIYAVDNGYRGHDTIAYSISCNGNTSTAKVYIFRQQPLSMQYAACDGASITMGFHEIDGVKCYWYDAPTGGNLVGMNPANTLTVTKNSTDDIGTWWVESIHGNIVFPRRRIELKSGDCEIETPQDCAKDGTLIRKNDFGNYSDGCLLINGQTAPDKLYQQTINNLCEGDELYLSLWARGCDALLKWTVYDATDNSVLATFAQSTLKREGTGACIKPDTQWKQYGFSFTLSEDVKSIYFDIYNQSPIAGGNSFAIDDIEARLCVPKVTVNITNGDTLICANSKLDIIGEYINDKCAFGNAISYRWEFRHVNSAKWEIIADGIASIDCHAADIADKTVKSKLKISPASKDNEGYYRMLLGSTATIDNVNCHAVSDSIYVRVVENIKAEDVVIDICPFPARHIHLTNFIDTLNYTKVSWVKVNSSAPDILNPETGEINSQNLNSTYTYKYSLSSKCGTSSAVVYAHSLKNGCHHKIDTIVICKSQVTNRFIHINRILGLDLAGGTWSYPFDAKKIIESNVMSILASSKYNEAKIFDAHKAWEEATANSDTDYEITYKGDTSARKFVFRYTAVASCIGSVQKNIVIIVTDQAF
jgi:hypothetical protein